MSFNLLIRPHRMHEMRTIAIDDPGRLSVCIKVLSLSVSLSLGFAVPTRLNGSRSCLGWRLLGTKDHCIRRVSIFLRGFDTAFAKLHWLLLVRFSYVHFHSICKHQCWIADLSFCTTLSLVLWCQVIPRSRCQALQRPVSRVPSHTGDHKVSTFIFHLILIQAARPIKHKQSNTHKTLKLQLQLQTS